MNLNFSPEKSRNTVFHKIEDFLSTLKLTVVDKDETRPWGGFYVIGEDQSAEFIHIFFPAEDTSFLTGSKLSPKILIVAPGKRLSWQYHFRRAELWKVLSKEVGVIRSDTDDEKEIGKYGKGSVINLKRGERHRLIGLDTWGIVAEIWEHSDKNDPSNEKDIVRLQDDYGR